jgi:hypothetical protein
MKEYRGGEVQFHLILDVDTRRGFVPRSGLTVTKSSRYPFTVWFGESQTLSRPFGERTVTCSCAESKHDILIGQAYSLVTTLTEVFRLIVEKDRQRTCNVTMRRVRLTTVVWKSNKY